MTQSGSQNWHKAAETFDEAHEAVTEALDCFCEDEFDLMDKNLIEAIMKLAEVRSILKSGNITPPPRGTT